MTTIYNPKLNTKHVLTKRMVRDLVTFKGPISLRSLIDTLGYNECNQWSEINVLIKHVLDLEHDGIFTYDANLGQYMSNIVLE